MDTYEPTEDEICFNILYGGSEVTFQLPQHNTVWDLKLEVFDKLKIPPSKQIIDCWCKSPEGDDAILGTCCDPDENNYLVVYDADNMSHKGEAGSEDVVMREEATLGDAVMTEEEEEEDSLRAMESRAAMDFIQYFSQNFDDRGILFHVCRLEDAISQACFTSLENRKILFLYMHNKSYKFAKMFAENLARPEVKEIVNRRLFLLGWDVENEEHHPALIDALSTRTELSSLVNFVEKKLCAALLIVPVKNSFTLFSCMKGKVSKKNFLETLKKAEEFLVAENESEEDLEMAEQSDNDIGSSRYQQIMLDLLGDRDYDSFEHLEFDQLKEKILYALYGPPESEDGEYNEKQQRKMQSLLDVIVKENNSFAKWKDRVVMSFIYNCTEPLPSEKKKRSKKYKDYNPHTDLTPVPIFVLRKCKKSENPCRMFVDDTGRVYRTWHAYLTRNKLPECEMILPLNGRYQADENGRVSLERHLSPSCGIDSKILQGTDIANTAVGLVSGGIFIAAAIPTITIAPVALVAAGATGIGVGLYSLGRSAYTLYDRSKHKETMSFGNSEARGAYLSIVAGSLGFVGAGANVAVSQLAARGFNIGQGATAAVNVMNVANIGASGINVVNSSYDVFNQWFNENQTPSLLTMVQLSSSILFFGHAIYNFKTCGAMIEESQARTLRDYHDTLRSNRHRKTFNKMMKETIRQNNGDMIRGQSEVIKTIINIQNKDEVFATLTRLNKAMNKNDVKFSADNGEIKLNGVSIDVGKFSLMDNNEVGAFLTSLPNAPEPSQNEIRQMNSRLQVTFRGTNPQEILGLAARILQIFANTDDSIKDKVINAVAHLVATLRSRFPGCLRELDKMFPGCDKLLRLLTMVNGYFQQLINDVEEKYQKWLATRDPEFEEPVFVKFALDFSKRMLQIFEFVSKAYFFESQLTEAGSRELLQHFCTWFAKQVVEFEENSKRKQERTIHSGSPARKTKCPDCGGVYYDQ